MPENSVAFHIGKNAWTWGAVCFLLAGVLIVMCLTLMPLLVRRWHLERELPERTRRGTTLNVLGLTGFLVLAAAAASLTFLGFAMFARSELAATTPLPPAASVAIDGPLDIPVKSPRVLAAMEQTHARFEADYDLDPNVSFDTALPKTWVHTRDVPKLFAAVFPARTFTVFADPNPVRPAVVAVGITPAPFEVAVDTWSRLLLEREGWAVIKGDWFPGPNGLFYDITATRELEHTPVVRRMSVRMSDAHIVAVSGTCTRDRWDELKEELWTAQVTFALLKASGDTTEKRVRAAAKRPDFETQAPASWSVESAKSAAKDGSGVQIRLTGDGDRVLANIVVRAKRHPAARKPSVTELLDSTRKLTDAAGAQLSAAPEPTPSDADPRAIAVPGWLGGFSARGQLAGSDIDVRIGFVQKETLTFTLLMLSPKLADETNVALRAQRAFEIVRAGLTTKER